MFDPFFTTKPNGIGLGLSICRSIVEAHGGRLSVSPVSPHGSVFQVMLPATTNKQQASRIEAGSASSDSSQRARDCLGAAARLLV
jgi:C4-dicarboxylate-specific signal transduction histidine kinase